MGTSTGDTVDDLLRKLCLEAHKHPEIRSKQIDADSVEILANRYPCYGDSGVYRIGWLRNRITRKDCGLVIRESEPGRLVVSLDKPRWSEFLCFEGEEVVS